MFTLVKPRRQPDLSYCRRAKMEFRDGAFCVAIPESVAESHPLAYFASHQLTMAAGYENRVISSGADEISFTGHDNFEVNVGRRSDAFPSAPNGTLVLGLGSRVYDNIGHFVADYLPTMLHLDELISAGVRNVLVTGSSPESHVFQRSVQDIMSKASNGMLGVQFAPFCEMEVHNAIVPARVVDHPGVKNTGLIRVIGAMQREGIKSRKLFISRKDASDRFLANEAEIFDALKPLGFEEIVATTMGLDERIEAFGQAALVVGVCGAAMANIAHCQRETPILTLRPDDMGAYWYYDLAALMGLQYHDLPGPTVAGVISNELRKSSDFTIQVIDVLKAVAQI